MIYQSLLVFAGLASTSAFVSMAPRVSTKVSFGFNKALQPPSSFALEAAATPPHGGKLVDQMLKTEEEKTAAMRECDFELNLNERQLCDVELIMQGGFSPLTGYMKEDDYLSVVNDLKLADGLIFSLPVVFDTDDDRVVPGAKILLKYQNVPIATYEVESRYKPNKAVEAQKCYGTTTVEHPAVSMIHTERGQFYTGGKIQGLNVPKREFVCQSPAEIREILPGDVDVVAFQCRNPIHRAHYELFTRALDDQMLRPNAVVLVHPTCGPTQPDDIPGVVRYKTYEVLKEQTKNPRTFWAYLPYSMHMAGPREAIQHMIIRKNFGCSHFIIGRDMAGCKSSIDGEDFYGPYEAQDTAKAKASELGITPVPSLNLVYTEEEDYVTADYAQEKGLTEQKLSGTKFRKMLRAGDDIPTWFAFESVVKVLRQEAARDEKFADRKAAV